MVAAVIVVEVAPAEDIDCIEGLGMQDLRSVAAVEVPCECPSL